MPIRADLRVHYGPEWQTHTRPRILDRAGHRCEHCSKPNRIDVETRSWSIPAWGMPTEGKKRESHQVHLMIWRQAGLAPGDSWIVRNGEPFGAGQVPGGGNPRVIRVVLTVAHLNHIAGDDRDENLAALCQWCHLIYDLEHHEESRAGRKDEDRPLLKLLSGPAAIDGPAGQTAPIK